MTRGSVDVEYLDMPQSGSAKRVDSSSIGNQRLPGDLGKYTYYKIFVNSAPKTPKNLKGRESMFYATSLELESLESPNMLR